jgi:signal transducing adaptor molecule
MFKAANPYDEIVAKATDENLTSENWQLNLDVCDKVNADGESGPRQCIAAILKRLVHRNANVQLYALTLSDALAKNCGITAHRELASRSYCQTLQRMIVDRNTHATVKRKGVALLKEWSQEWGKDETLGIVRETVEALRTQGISFKEEQSNLNSSTTPNEPSSEQLRAEDEELRKALELSLRDQGGRNATSSQFASSASAAAGTASTSAKLDAPASSTSAYTHSSAGSQQQGHLGPTNSSNDESRKGAPTATRVRALYDFTPTEEGELAFQKGDVLRVLDSVYEHWWRGELRGQAGIFPVNYVELLPDPTPADIQREAELEAHIFAQANDIDRLLGRLRGMDPNRDNLADDEELQELYQSSLTMRPRIVKLIDRYNLKVNELRTMNDKFIHARATYDAMMEQSLARYSNSQNEPWQSNAGMAAIQQQHQQNVQPSSNPSYQQQQAPQNAWHGQTASQQQQQSLPAPAQNFEPWQSSAAPTQVVHGSNLYAPPPEAGLDRLMRRN